MTAVTPVDAGSLDDGAIALDAVLQQVGELLRGSANRRVAVGIEMLNHLRFADRLRHLGVEARDDRLRQGKPFVFGE